MPEEKKENKKGQERIQDIVKGILVIKKNKEFSKDGMFAKKSRVVGMNITRIL